MSPSSRVIAHLDMDAFYASVELLRYPELRGLAVVIGGGRRSEPQEVTDAGTGKIVRRFFRLRDYAGRGVTTTATYEARALGVHSALGLMKAARLAPDAVLLPSDFEAYAQYSRRFKAAVRAIAPLVENSGIDEIYIDLAGVSADLPLAGTGDSVADTWLRARAAALAIKDAVRIATGLSCSIGLAPNKLLAKIASELDKPDGLTVLTAADIPGRIWPMAARRINGIGPKTSAKLETLGIHTIGELAQAEPSWLIQHFGQIYGAWMHDAAYGRDQRPVVTHSETKSISRETTFARDLHAVSDRDELSRIFTELCTELAGDLQRKGYVAKTIGLKLRYDNFKTVTRDQTIAAPTDDARAIRRAAGECLKRVPLERRIRLLGVRAASLWRPDEFEADNAGRAKPIAAEPGINATSDATPSLFD